MKRVILAAVIAAALFAFGQRPAQAMVEFCPATLSYARVGSETALIREQSSKDATGKASPQTSSVYGLQLGAFGTRTITQAALAFDTSDGWYTIDVPGIALSEKDRHYTAPWVSFTRRDYVSPVFYVHFPHAVTVRHAWVVHAAAKDDDAFGWASQGTVTCDAYAAASPQQTGRIPFLAMGSPYTLDPEDEEHLSAPPSSASLIISATPSAPLKTAACAEPFRVATVKTEAQPHYPRTLMGPASQISTAVEVAINADGTLADAWIWGPSGFSAFDDEALRTAKASSYTGSAAYCEPVPGFYFFRVTFDPNS